MSTSTSTPTAPPLPPSSSDPIPTVDVVGVGLGPFNLGLAALAAPLVAEGSLTARFFDARPEFCWHPGMMLPNATIQVPFLADLVTLADPTSHYSFLNYLKVSGRIHRYYIRESFYPLRSEYSDYCAWVARQLDFLTWGHRVESVVRTPEGRWRVTARDEQGATAIVDARVVVSGVGTTPAVPFALEGALGQPGVVHSSDYLPHRQALLNADSVTIVGSGQSAAEIYRDLMEERAAAGRRLDWFTRSPRFFPMEYTKLTLEMTSPEYTAYFHSLPTAERDRLNRVQRTLYKGISGNLVDDIYDTLYQLSVGPHPLSTTLRASVECAYLAEDEPATDGSTGRYRLAVHHTESGARGVHATDMLVLATGYHAPRVPEFLESSRDALRLTDDGRLDVGLSFDIDDAGTLFVQNAEEHTHGLSAPDLGMGPWRNSILLQRITGSEVYPIERSMAFQDFGGERL